MNDQAFALLIIAAVASVTAILMRGFGATHVSLVQARLGWRSLSPVVQTSLLLLLATYSMSHAIQWRYVFRTQGIVSAAGLVVASALPWFVTGLVFFGSQGGRASKDAVGGFKSYWSTQRLTGCVLFAVSASAAWALWRSNGSPLIIDEALYLFQAKLLQHSSLSLSIDPSWEPFFAVKQAVAANGKVYAQYPPGWALMLAAWSTVAPAWLLGPVLAGGLVLSTFQVARCLYGGTIGMIAAALMATSGSVLLWGATLMSDLPTACLIVASAAAAGSSVGTKGRTRSALLDVASGFLLGLAFATRPLSALSATPLVLAVGLLTRPAKAGRRRPLALRAMLMAGGGVPMLAALLAYNYATNGEPLEFGYERANGSLHDLGFGLRGFIDYSDLGRAIRSAGMFTLRDALVSTGRTFGLLDHSLLGGFFLPVFSAAVVRRQVPRGAWFLILAAMVLPLVHLLWFFIDVRYYLPLTPFLAVVVAGAIHKSLDITSVAGRKAGVVLLVCNLAMPVSCMILDGFWSNPMRRARTTVTQLAALNERRVPGDSLIVFVFDPGKAHPNLWRLYPFNAEYDLQRPIKVVRDLGRMNSYLMQNLDGWTAVCIDAAQPTVIRAIVPGNEPTCRDLGPKQ